MLAFDSNTLHCTDKAKEGIPNGIPSFAMVETIGIEPMTPCTSSRYSNQLS